MLRFLIIKKIYKYFIKVPITNRVGELGQGFTIAMEGLNGGTNRFFLLIFNLPHLHTYQFF